MEISDYEKKIGTIFSVKLDTGKAVNLELTTVDPLDKAEGFDGVREQPFTLVFVGPKDNHLPDNTYTMSVENEEEHMIFISAHKEDETGIHYDAVFN